MVKTSYSALHTFQTCPLRYKAQYIDKIPFPQSVEAFLGVALHTSFEYMLKPGTPLPSEEDVWKHFLSLWTANKGIDHERDEKHVKDARAMIQAFYASNKDLKDAVYEVESYFSLRINNHEITGYIDRIDKISDSEEYEIIDYKTGRFVQDDIDMVQNLQLGIYTLAFLERSPMFPPDRIVTSIYNNRLNTKMSYVSTKDDLAKVEGLVIDTIHEIEKSVRSGVFGVQRNRFCTGCVLKNTCPAWK
jgi:RecB family exonuclease